MARKKFRQYRVSLTEEQDEALQVAMKKYLQNNLSSFVVFVLGQMIGRGMLGPAKPSKQLPTVQVGEPRGRGRPRKVGLVVEPLLYPAPEESGVFAPYTEEEWRAYYEYHGTPMPELPDPLTVEELKEYE